ncbi:MAG: 3-isopropylmalate dehydratase small subunit [Anaerolineales bacterium]|nr:3-isopropylmalate dehydratase small subunit [Anaerolineales bacterium]
MQIFHTLKSLVIPLPNNDVDTDQIIPARYLKGIEKKGLAEGLFAGWRYLSSGDADPSFPLNNPHYREAKILLAGNNFGCGSSREHAPWALVQWGIRAVISTSFADIFRSNALKNGLLPIEVVAPVHNKLFEIINADSTFEVTIDLPSQNLLFSDGFQVGFSIDPFSKNCLVQGIDSLGYLLNHLEQIMSFENENILAGYPEINTTNPYYPDGIPAG